MTVRDAQYGLLNLGYSSDELLRNCPKAPEGRHTEKFGCHVEPIDATVYSKHHLNFFVMI